MARSANQSHQSISSIASIASGGIRLNFELPADTYTVSQLGHEIRAFLEEAFFAVWVVGEVERPRMSQRGHLYFELLEKGERDSIVGKLDAVLWRSDHQRVRRVLSRANQEITDGQLIRCRAQIDFYPPSGRLQLVVREVDPLFTLGLLAQRRQETLNALAAQGLLERNRSLSLSPVPLRIGLVTSRGSAAYHDFLSTLRESGYGFQVVLVHAAVQGREAERTVASGLASLRARGIDCAVLVRGGGSRTDLAAFDSRAVALAIARAPFPVLTGLGHETDQSIADLVAHRAFKTPTRVAEFLVQSVWDAEAALDALQSTVCRLARARIDAALRTLQRTRQGLRLAELRLKASSDRLDELSRRLGAMGRERIRQSEARRADISSRLGQAAPRLLERRRKESRSLAWRVVDLARSRLRETRTALDSLSRLCFQLAPQRTLERGFSITRDSDGRPLRQPDQVAAGDRIRTQLALGTLESRVERGEMRPP